MNEQQLRASILQMAIEGRLVPQDPNDKPVEIDSKDVVPEEEQPFAIPENWRWVKLDAVGQIRGGKRIPIGRKLVTVDTGHKYLRVTDMKGGTVDQSNLLYIEEDIYERIKKYTISSDDIYITVAGTIGNVGLIPEELDGINLTENADKICPDKAKVNKKWLFYYLQSEYIQTQIKEATTKVGQPKLAIRKISSLCITIPPLPEQKRIVTRIEELMPIVEAYGEAQEHLAKLDKELPDKMKQSILQTAIQGKLVPQDPNDKPVEIDSKDIVPKDEQPFEIPENWRWYTVSDCVEIGPRVSADDELEATFIPMAAISTGYDSKLENPEIKKWEKIKKGYSRFSNGDIIFARITPCFQNLKSTIVNNLKNAIGAGSTEFHVLRPSRHIYDKYLLYFLKSPYLLEYGKEHLQGTAGQQRFTREDLGRCCIPLPPVSEQKNIIILIEKLFKEIDELAISM